MSARARSDIHSELSLTKRNHSRPRPLRIPTLVGGKTGSASRAMYRSQRHVGHPSCYISFVRRISELVSRMVCRMGYFSAGMTPTRRKASGERHVLWHSCRAARFGKRLQADHAGSHVERTARRTKKRHMHTNGYSRDEPGSKLLSTLL